MTQTDFIAFEYMETRIPKSLQNAYIDGYQNFGWTTIDSTPDVAKNAVTLKLKRDRNLPEKASLNRLQKQFEQEMAAVVGMEKSKTTIPTITALIVGLIGTAFMAGSVFAFIGGLTLLSIILAIPGFAGWALGYFSFGWTQTRQTARVGDTLSAAYDAAASYCQSAFRLLN
jgi:hypothetical protein